MQGALRDERAVFVRSFLGLMKLEIVITDRDVIPIR